MKNKFLKYGYALFCFLLVLGAAASSTLSVKAQEAVTEVTIKIKDVEDLLEFAEKCTLDTWSQDKTVVLQADIYMEDIAFEPIATFGGIFDGKGHSIVGLEIRNSVSPAGLFGVLQEGAVVKSLNVLGKVMPSGESNMVGGIAGENHGQIRNCTFTGMVYGSSDVGGIAGVNGVSGSIQNCRVSGDIQGSLRTGGVIGHNRGIVENSKNDASVNMAKVDPQISMEDINLDISMDVTQWTGIRFTDAASDTGGIAGYSSGVIHECSNAGTVGYSHIGYNLGGIAGRSSGYIASCDNTGEVYGRKDIGGIAGQMEPYILVELTESAVSEIGKELDALGSMIDHAKKHSDQSNVMINRRISKIESYLESLQKGLEKYAVQEPEEIPEDQGITEALSKLLPTEQSTELRVQMDILIKQVELLAGEALNNAGTLKDDVGNIVSQTEVLSGTVEAVMEQAEKLSLSDFVEDISQWDPQKATLGKVSDCANNGPVYGDKNVGGITGSMSMEYEIDPEDDLTAELSMKERRQYQLTDIISESVNYAPVTGKKDYVGGICGHMDLGYISESINYGPVSSQNGDYVGGIAGWTGSTVRNCFVKCSLSGQNYIGGVVGSGITEDVTGESSLVSQCYTMVEVSGYRQFVGAVAGVYRGLYEECYFVSEDLAGINRVSYAGKAEPMTYEALLDIKNLPDEFENMEYLPKDESTALTNMAGLSVIASAEVREDGRPIFLAEGQFSSDVNLVVTEEEKNFQPKELQSFWERLQHSEVVEQWRIKVPEDGLLIRTLRYYIPENLADTMKLYVKQNGDWKLTTGEEVGSYLLFNIAGCEAEIAVVTTHYIWGYWLMAALLLMFVAGGGIWMIRNKKDILKWLIGSLAVILCALLIVVLLVLKDSKFINGLGAYQLLQQYLEQPKQTWELKVQAKLAEESMDLEAEIGIVELEGQRITCINIADARFFYADGILYLENGDAYRASEVSADYGSMLQQLAKMYESLDIEMVKEDQSKIYQLTVQEEYAQDILGYLIPGILESDLEMPQLKAELVAQEETISNILLTAKGKLQDDEKTKYQVSAVLTPTDINEGQLELPEVVKTAIQTENKSVQAVITKDVFRLYHGWKALAEQNTMGAQVYLAADCGPLALAEDFAFVSSKIGETRINSVRKDDFVIYFNEDTICSENGYGVTAKRARAAEAAELLSIAYELCLQGGFRCMEVNDSYIYSIALDESGMAKIAGLIAKESQDLAIRFENGSVQLVIKEDELESIRFACDGELDVILTKVAVALSAEIKLQDETQYLNYDIPQKVVEKLVKEE